MPFTPYHFGPSGFVGLLFRRWIDVPVFVAANVLIDVEVIADGYIEPGWPVHQLWHFHTLLIGGLVGAVFGLCVFYLKPLRWCSEKSMSLLGLSGKATLLSMALAGLLGACFHVLIDSCYHYDVQIFWPHAKNPVFHWLRTLHPDGYRGMQQQVQLWCLIFWALMIGLYGFLLAIKWRRKKKDEITK